MYILGFESSCDETSCAVVEMDEAKGTRKILANIVASQIEIHRLYGGVVPEIAGRAHIEAISRITYEALDTAGITLSDVGLVAVTAFPGLIGALLVGVNFAKSLAFANNIPLVAVNHVHAHVCAALLDDTALKPPFLALVVSGGHTFFYEVSSFTDFLEIGQTSDDAVGEAFDKIGRVIGMPYPGGAAMDRLAYEGNPGALSLPSPALLGDNLTFSFSGIKTATLNYINSAKQRGEEISHADIAASYTATIVNAIVRKSAMALERTGADTLVLAGGVAANSHLRRALSELCENGGVIPDTRSGRGKKREKPGAPRRDEPRPEPKKFRVPPLSLCGDNAAMVAAAGYYEFLAGRRDGVSLNASATEQ